MGKLQTLAKVARSLYTAEISLGRLYTADFKTKGEKEKLKVSKRRLKQLVDDIHNLYESRSKNAGFRS